MCIRDSDKALVDYAFHMIITDPSPAVLNDELPQLIQAGYTSFKLYMSYAALKLNDRQILDVLALARRENAMVMLHAENHDCVDWLTEQLPVSYTHLDVYKRQVFYNQP